MTNDKPAIVIKLVKEDDLLQWVAIVEAAIRKIRSQERELSSYSWETEKLALMLASLNHYL